MVNYIDYITLNNQWIDTKYDFNNVWDSVEVILKAWYVEDQTKNVRLINEDVYHWNENPCRMELGCERINTIYTTYYYYNSGYNNYSMGLAWGPWSPVELKTRITQDDNNTTLTAWYNGDGRSSMTQPTVERYKVYRGSPQSPLFFNILPIGRIYIGSLLKNWEWNIFKFYYFQLKVNNELVVDLKACLDEDWNEAVYDEINWEYVAVGSRYTNSMIKTVVMSWDRQELPIDDGIEKNKIANRIIEVNKYTDGYAACYDEISISADEDNLEWIEVSDYTIENQINQGWVADFIELKPRWTLVLPRNRQISALNRPLVKGHKWDLLRIVVR